MSELLTDNQCAQAIYNLVSHQLSIAIREEIESASKVAAAKEGDRLWNANPDNGLGMNSSPYKIEAATDRLVKDVSNRIKWQRITNYAVSTFLSEKVQGAAP